MKFVLKPLVLALLIGTSPFAGALVIPTPHEKTAAPAGQPALAPRSPDSWIVYDDATYTPVVDAVSRHLDAARKAFDAKDDKMAAREMRAVAEELRLQADRARKDDLSVVKSDEALLAADVQAEKDTIKRMNASALKASAAAAAIESGKIKSKADLDMAINKAARADLEHRWLVSDVATWYPVTEEPQRHFTDAVAASASNDYKSAAADVRKATSFLRLEAGRATGDAKQELHSSIVQLDKLAACSTKAH
jgi:hypothetical protein